MTPPAPAERPPLSAYVRTLNEERRIEACVTAALKVAREVVALDSGSTDDTVARARAAGATVREQPWLGSGRQKRAAEDACTYDWLLDLDADEVVSPELAASIRGLFAGGEPKAPAYGMDWVIVPPIGEAWTRTDVKVRVKLYDRTRLRMPDHAAWDQLDTSGVRVPRLAGPLHHHAFTDIGDLTRKIERNMTGRAAGVPNKPIGWLRVRIVLGLPVYFAKRYLGKGLWRRGTYGFAFCMAQAYGRWLKDVKLYERHRMGER